MGQSDRQFVVPVPHGGADVVRFLETMPAAFCFLDTQWRFRYINAEAERLMDRPRGEVLGESLWEAFPGISGSIIEETYRQAAATGRPMAFETPHRTLPGRWVEARVWPGPDGVALYVLDATDRRDAEASARQATARTALLARVSAELAGELDTESALGRLAQLVVPVLTDACIVTVVDREGRARDVGSWHTDPDRRPLMQRYSVVRLDSLPTASPVAQALHAGTAVTESVDAVLRLMRPGPARDLLVALDPATAVVLPLTADGRTVGVLTLYLDAGRTLSEADLETARQVAAEAGRAVARVHKQSQQALLAEALQRSLLTDPAAMGDAQIVVRYVPAAEAARVGGDWYDAFPQRDGTPVLVIGDVVGHDTAAAASMGQLRALLRGIAHYSGSGPAEVLRGLDEAIADMHTDTLATAAVARLEATERGGRLVPAPVGQRRSSSADRDHPPRRDERPRRRDRRPDAGGGLHDRASRVGVRPGPGVDRAAVHRRPDRAAGEQPRRRDGPPRRAGRPTGRQAAGPVLRRAPGGDAAGHPAGRRRPRRRPPRPLPSLESLIPLVQEIGAPRG